MPSSTRFNRLSTFQLNSPSILAPTNRPLPFRVWNTRRIGRSNSGLPGAERHGGSSCSRLPISSSNSSEKTSRISSSISSLALSKLPINWPATGAADTGAATADAAAATTAATGIAGVSYADVSKPALEASFTISAKLGTFSAAISSFKTTAGATAAGAISSITFNGSATGTIGCNGAGSTAVFSTTDTGLTATGSIASCAGSGQ